MVKTAIITGATGGIGKEFVKVLLNEDLDAIWVIARNKEKLKQLEDEFGEKIHSISLDLSDQEDIKKFERMLTLKKPDICYLINNAGLAKMAPSTDFSPNEIEDTITLNCIVPLLMCNHCIPFMKRGSHILNISSAAAFQPTPYINLYASTKVFERSYSRALHVELIDKGISVTAVCPGWVDTPMLSKEMNGRKVRFPGMVHPEKVVVQAIKDAKKGKDMSVCSLFIKAQHFWVKLMPQRLVMRIWMKGIREYI